MSPFRRGKTWYTRIPSTTGGPGKVRRLSSVKPVATDMQRMLDDLRGREVWDVLAAIERKDRRATLGRVYAAWQVDASLKTFRASLDDIDLSPLVDEYERVALIPKHGEGTHSGHSTTRAVQQLRTLMPEGVAFPRSRWTVQTLEQWRAGLACSEATKAVYWSSARQFERWAVSRGLLPGSVMRDMTAPKLGKPRKRHLSLEDALRLADAQVEPFRTMEVLATCGLEFTALYLATARDVDPVRKTIHAHGTKRASRDRIVAIPEWAWPYLADTLKGKHPDARLFPTPSPHLTPRGQRRALYKAMNASHREACLRLGIEDYRLHDARHTYAVRLKRAGTPSDVVAKALGHATKKQVDAVYGTFEPTVEEAEHWERVAKAREASDEQQPKGGER